MTILENEMKEWIDNATGEELLHKWRFEPLRSPWLMGVIGKHLDGKLSTFLGTLTPEAYKELSQRIGWKYPPTKI